jgi:transposase, IS30 family
MKYKHFSIEEREKIQEMLWQKFSIRAIAKTLGRSPSSVSREITRNINLKRRYTPRVAHNRALEKRKSRGRKLRLKSGFIRRYVVEGLKAGLSPEQIAGRLSLEYPNQSISHEAVYQYVYSLVYRSGYGYMRLHYHDLRPYLKRRHKRRQRKGLRKSQRIWRPKGLSIDLRPKRVEKRKEIGHWETDSMVSRHNAVGLNTLVERKTGLVCITKIGDQKAKATTEAVTKRLKPLPAFSIKTITSDNGNENAFYDRVQNDLDLSWYFAHPYSSWERGTNENTNGLIRWYMPKGTDFDTITDEELEAIEYALNTRPRKRLGWKTPLEAFNESVALTH